MEKERLSVCCGAKPLGEVLRYELYDVGRCSRCKDGSLFTCEPENDEYLDLLVDVANRRPKITVEDMDDQYGIIRVDLNKGEELIKWASALLTLVLKRYEELCIQRDSMQAEKAGFMARITELEKALNPEENL